MKIFEVNTNFLQQQFLELPGALYRDQPLWTVQLGQDIEHAFSVDIHKKSDNLHSLRWLVYDNLNKPSGRIAAFSNWDEGWGAFGFFECVNCQETANLLLSTAENWLLQNGCKRMLGPLNYHDSDRFWGLLTEGFNKPALYRENFNNHYYEKLIRGYGLKEYETLFTCMVSLHEMPLEKLHRVAERFMLMHQITVKQFSFEELEHFAQDICHIYLQGGAPSSRFTRISNQDIEDMIHMSEAVIDDHLLWLAYQNGRPVGVLAFMPDLNQIIRKKLKRERSTVVNLKGFVLSSVPDERNFEVEVVLGDACCTALTRTGKNYDLHFCGINKHSSRMISFLTTMNAMITTTHKTFINTPQHGTLH